MSIERTALGGVPFLGSQCRLQYRVSIAILGLPTLELLTTYRAVQDVVKLPSGFKLFHYIGSHGLGGNLRNAEHLGSIAPTGELHEDALFLGCRRAILGRNLLAQLPGAQIGLDAG